MTIIAFALLIWIVLHMGYEGLRNLISKKVKEEKLEFHSFTKILIISLATNLDAFGVVTSLGIASKPIFLYITSIGTWFFIVTIFGLYLAKKLSQNLDPILTLSGSIILGIITFQILET